MILLKQSTAATLRVGPFMDATDGVTPETGVALGTADQAEALKHTGATVDISAATWAAITGADGWYDLSLTTSHTDTLGMLTIVVQDASVCLPVFVRAMVVPANIYDSLVGGSDILDVSVTQFGGTAGTFASGRPEVNASHIAGSAVSTSTAQIGVNVVNAAGTAWGSGAITAASIASDAITAAKVADDVSTEIRDKVVVRTCLRGTVTTGGTTTSIPTSAMSPATSVLDQVKGRIVIFDHDTTTAALRGQATDITASSASATPTLTVTALTTAPASGDTFTIV